MNLIIPENFVQFTAGVFALVALICVCVSSRASSRDHSTRLAAVLIISMLALFANHWAVYFTALFIVATAVTELEFLQNLAAIVRGNSDYFKYKIEELGQREIQEKVEKEQRNLHTSKARNEHSLENEVAIKKERVNTIVSAEKLALDKMEEYFEQPIKRNVRVSSNSGSVELDGLIPSVVDDMVSEKIIEVKYLRSPKTFGNFLNIFHRIEAQARQYCKIANKIARLHIVLVIEGDNTLNQKDIETLKTLVDRSSIATGYSVFTTTDLGLQLGA